jgi:hypothetical protein
MNQQDPRVYPAGFFMRKEDFNHGHPKTRRRQMQMFSDGACAVLR